MTIFYRIVDSILIASIPLALGIYTLRLNPKRDMNRLILLICLWFAVRNLTALMAAVFFKELSDITTLFKINFFFNATLFCLNLHFFLLLVRKKSLPPWLLVLVYLPMLAFSALALVDHRNFVGLIYREGEWRVMFPPRGKRAWTWIFYWVQLLYLTTALIAALQFRGRAASHRERRQGSVLLGGLSVYFLALAAQPHFPRALSPVVLVYPMFAYILSLCFATLRYSFLSPRPSTMTEDLIAHVDDAVFLLDLRLVMTQVNQAAERLLSAPQGSLKGRPFPSLIRGGLEEAKSLERFLGGSEFSLRLRLAFEREGGDAAAVCYLSKVKDRFSDLVGVLVIAKELPGRRDFRNLYRITDREMEVVDLVLSGSSNQAVGATLGISERTVEAHCLHVYNKLGIGNKAELIKLSAKYDLLP